LLLALGEVPLPSIGVRQAGTFELHADELGAIGLAVLLQPIRVDQAQPVVVGLGNNRLQECVLPRQRSVSSFACWGLVHQPALLFSIQYGGPGRLPRSTPGGGIAAYPPIATPSPL